uniref:Uncharacterized protein n=1 Tax=Rhizophora mucronata TaxID=61149 RepID=A0A2P2R2G6_RHIMU
MSFIMLYLNSCTKKFCI